MSNTIREEEAFARERLLVASYEQLSKERKERVNEAIQEMRASMIDLEHGLIETENKLRLLKASVTKVLGYIKEIGEL